MRRQNMNTAGKNTTRSDAKTDHRMNSLVSGVSVPREISNATMDGSIACALRDSGERTMTSTPQEPRGGSLTLFLEANCDKR